GCCSDPRCRYRC
uniref:Alpha-conotoxin-like Reg1e n=2 Tax=Conus regius TaxID=101314 RepID=CA1E_CONRE|nr:RecName: Full=Alpha-conotoxin-like Reg1e [Conus regius]